MQNKKDNGGHAVYNKIINNRYLQKFLHVQTLVLFGRDGVHQVRHLDYQQR